MSLPPNTRTKPYRIFSKQPLKEYSLKPHGAPFLLSDAVCQKQNNDDKNKVTVCFLAYYLFTTKILRPSSQYSVNTFMYVKPQTTDAQKPNVKAFLLQLSATCVAQPQTSGRTLINFILWRKTLLIYEIGSYWSHQTLQVM